MSEPCKTKYTRFGKPYNALAGLKRNTDIAEYGEVALSIWDGKSKGTKDTMDKMTALGKHIKVVIV